MKKLITICLVVGIILAANSVASANFWMDPEDLDNMTVVCSEPAGGTITSVTPTSAPDGRIAFKYIGQTAQDNGGKVQIGYRWSPAGSAGANSYNGKPFPDLSNYDDFSISFHNQGSEAVQVNVWLNTGYTDTGWEQLGTYAQNGWLEVAPCTWKDLVLDFDAAEMWQDTWPSGPWGVHIASGQIPYLNHVTGLGISLITPGNKAFSVDVDTVPEPATIVLLGLGALSLLRRKR